MLILTPIILAVLVGGLLISSCFLWVCARWLGASSATFWRALVVASAITALGLLNSALSIVVANTEGDELSGVVSVVFLAATFLLVVITMIMIQRILGVSLGRAILIWFLHAIMSFAVAVPITFVLKALVVSAYIQSSNSMAPTIVGWHQTDNCPLCHGQRIVPNFAPKDPMRVQRAQAEGFEDELCICTSCKRMSKSKPGKEQEEGPDRMLVSLLAAPQRWDVVVFRFPLEPKQKWVFRLVGLPGETVYLKDGAVWINDVKLVTPAELGGLQFSPYAGDHMPDRGSEKNPIRLGQNECCVLGDFPERCSDSRHWGPVPFENIEGVVCAIYWPPARWRALR